MKEVKTCNSNRAYTSWQVGSRQHAAASRSGDRSGNVSHHFKSQAVSLRHILRSPLFRLPTWRSSPKTLPPGIVDTRRENPSAFPIRTSAYTGLSAEETSAHESAARDGAQRAEADPECCVLKQCLDRSSRVGGGSTGHVRARSRDLLTHRSVTPYTWTRRSISCCRSGARHQCIQRSDREVLRRELKGTYGRGSPHMVFTSDTERATVFESRQGTASHSDHRPHG